MQLAGAIADDLPVARIDLSANGLGNDSVAALARTLEGNRWVTWLNLGGNAVDDGAARELVRVLRTHGSLRYGT